jgi:hypothetical protein
VKQENGGWTSPQVIMAALGMLSMTIGSYLAIQRDDSEQVRAVLNDHARRLAILETRLEYMKGRDAPNSGSE